MQHLNFLLPDVFFDTHKYICTQTNEQIDVILDNKQTNKIRRSIELRLIVYFNITLTTLTTSK